jgi:5-dehydro-2-deoxygluconokinase
MLNPNRVYMLAADHRWQWEQWCDAHAVPRARISETKELARRGFMLARERSAAARAYGALLLDEQYASRSIARALEDGIEVGTPAEKAGAFPLEWASEPFLVALTGRFVKVLIRSRDDDLPSVRDGQLARLLLLQQWCLDAGKPLIVEVLVPSDGEPEQTFEKSGRPTRLAALIRACYQRGLTPLFWKVEGTSADPGARVIDQAVREQQTCRQILLGKAADLATIAGWFRAARHSSSASGFAIGRSVFWSPSTALLIGTVSEQEAVEQICASYLDLIGMWEG